MYLAYAYMSAADSSAAVPPTTVLNLAWRRKERRDGEEEEGEEVEGDDNDMAR